MDWTELIGFAGSALVVLSLTRTSVVKLRTISLIGSLTFIVYAVLIESIPILITNAAIAVINVWFLARELNPTSARGRDLGASRIRPDSPFLLDFVEFHLDDIRSFQPEFEMPTGDDTVALMLTRDGLPAGLVLGRRDGDRMTIVLDYVLGRYRDSRLGRWLFGPGASVFRTAGITHLTADARTEAHTKYLERVGFVPAGDDHLTMAL